MKAKNINIKVTTSLIIAVLSAILFVGGIPMIIIGASSQKIVMILGIIFVAVDFYACPILFIKYGEAVSLKRVVKAVNEEHIYEIKTLSAHTGKTEEFIKQQIRQCIDNGYIAGLLFDGEKLYFNDNQKADKKLISVKCLNCGATINYYSNESPVCPYCGTPYEKK